MNTATPGPAGSTGTPGPANPPEVVVRDNEVEDRFELFVDGVPAGVLGYEVQGNAYALIHTEIEPEFEGRGMGSQLVTHALDQLRVGHHGVLPFCPFVLSYIEQHPEYLDMVHSNDRSRFGLPAHGQPG